MEQFLLFQFSFKFSSKTYSVMTLLEFRRLLMSLFLFISLLTLKSSCKQSFLQQFENVPNSSSQSTLFVLMITSITFLRHYSLDSLMCYIKKTSDVSHKYVRLLVRNTISRFFNLFASLRSLWSCAQRRCKWTSICFFYQRIFWILFPTKPLCHTRESIDHLGLLP